MLEKNRVQQLDIPSRKGYDAIFNSNFLEDIPAALSQWGSSRVLLVASKALAANSSHISALQSALGPTLADTKLGVGSHSPYADVRDIAQRIQRHRADCVISVGSCSYSDACKIGCLLAANFDPAASFDEADMEALVDRERGIADRRADGTALRRRKCRLVTVPTSLSASEWNALSSATNAQGKKQHFGGWDDGGQPDLILLDPELAATSPERLWLSSGLGAVANVMHGITSCIMLAPVLRWQAANLSNPHYKATQAKILGIFNETLSWQETSAADAVERFVKSLGLPTTLRDVGVVSDEEVRRIADKTMTDVWGGGKRQMEFENVMEVLNSVRG
ncbi:hypothetical protein PLICBS_009717 [Purpureocillium lilacinum]|uniref:uncharacterized protein n=1 Tax=Purpureocillium lilacinum TaxID=33203 RepID=UPI00208CF22D|nr:hypothetical protein PLICBS_009717 [Purpureocillium lilacinum]